VTVKITKPHLKQMALAMGHPLGVVTAPVLRGGLGRSAWERMMSRLCAAGLFRPYAHGGYEITAEGRRAANDASQRARVWPPEA
jgi:hypothetical protein